MAVCVIKRGSDIEGQVVGSVSLLLMRGTGDIKSYRVEVPSCQELHLRTYDLIASQPHDTNTNYSVSETSEIRGLS